ncbi:MAG: hypothetical protein ABSG48_01070 [Geobacteraceae bacterium]
MVSKEKKRYYLSLTQSNVERFQELCKEENLNPAALSQMVDKFIEGAVQAGEEMKRETGRFDLFVLFAMMPEGKKIPKTKGIMTVKVKEGMNT